MVDQVVQAAVILMLDECFCSRFVAEKMILLVLSNLLWHLVVQKLEQAHEKDPRLSFVETDFQSFVMNERGYSEDQYIRDVSLCYTCVSIYS